MPFEMFQYLLLAVCLVNVSQITLKGKQKISTLIHFTDISK